MGTTRPVGVTSDGLVVAFVPVTDYTPEIPEELWVGKGATWTRYALPHGSQFFSIDGQIVRVAVAVSGLQYDLITVDTAAHTSARTALADGSWPAMGEAGYWVWNNSAHPQEWSMFRWDNSFVRTGPGYNTDALAMSTFGAFIMNLTHIELYPAAGVVSDGQPTDAQRQLVVGTPHIDNSGLTWVQWDWKAPHAGQVPQLCRLEVTSTTGANCVAASFLALGSYYVYEGNGVTVILDIDRGGFWVMPTGSPSRATFVPRTDDGSGSLSDQGGVILFKADTGDFFTFTTDGKMVPYSAAVH